MENPINLKESIKTYFKDKFNIFFIALLIFALIIRLKFIGQETIWNDETFYIWYSLKFLKEPSFLFALRFAGMQFVGLIIAFFKIFIKDAVLAGRIAALFFSIAGIALIYNLGKIIKNKTTGLIAAIFLSVNNIYWFIGNKVLLDAPSATMFTFVAVCLIMYEKRRTRLWSILLAFSIAATLMTKSSNILVIPFIIIYFLLVYLIEPLISKKDIKAELTSLLKRKSLYIVILFTLIFLIPYFINNLLNFHSLFPFSSGLTKTTTAFVTGTASRGGEYLETLGGIPFYLTWYLIPFFVLGVVLTIVYRKKEDYLLLSWLSFLVLFTLLTGGIKDARYALPVIPAMLLISAVALSEIHLIVNKFTKFKISPWIFVVIAMLLSIPFYQTGNLLFTSKQYSYTGYKEAGEWAKNNIPKDSFFIVGSPGFIRLFSGYDFILGTFGNDGSEDGTIYYGLPATQEEFEKLLTNTTKDIYLEVDMWEYINQGWAYPLNQEKLDYLVQLGFKPIYVVERELPTEKGLSKVPVIFMFKKE